MVDTPSSKPEPDAPSGRSPQPFRRGQITWSRPPQPVFRVAPPPRAQTSAPAPSSAPVAAPFQTQFAEAPRRPGGPGILSGSMIPKARPASTPAATPPPTPSPAVAERKEPDSAPTAPVLASATAPEPVVPSYAVAHRPSTRVPMAAWMGAAVGAIVLAAAGWWLLKSETTVPATVDVASTPLETPTAALSIAPVEAVPVADSVGEPADEVETAAPARAATTPAATSASVALPPRTAAPTAAQAGPPRPNPEPAAPRIETAPLAVAPAAPPPTAAETPASDPDAPIRTRPQPLN